MSKGKKILIGLLTIWPFIYIFLFILLAGGIAFFASSNPQAFEGSSPPPSFIIGAGSLVLAHFATILVVIGMLIFYIIHSLKNPAVEQDKKVWWILGFFFCGGIVNIVYYFMYIWKLPETAGSGG